MINHGSIPISQFSKDVQFTQVQENKKVIKLGLNLSSNSEVYAF